MIFFITNLDSTIVNAILPSLASAFSVTVISLNILVIGFLVAFAFSIPLVEFLVDRLGLKNVFMVACLLFGISSFLCTLSQTDTQLTFFRILQGFTAGCFTPIARSVAIKVSDHHSLAKNLANVLSLGVLGQVLGPVVGGYLVHYWGWKSIFYLNIPLCAIAFFYILFFMEAKKFNVYQIYPFDLVGYSLLSAGILLLFMLFDQLEYATHLLLPVILLLLLGIGIWVFKWHLRTYTQRFILDFRLLQQNTAFRLAIILSSLSRQYTSSIYFFLVVVLDSRKISSIEIGYFLLSFGLGVWMSKFFAKSIDVHSVFKLVRKALWGVLLLTVPGFFYFVQSTSWIFDLIFLFSVGFSISFFYSALNTFSFSVIEKSSSTAASSFSSLLINLCQSSGVALFSLFFYWIHHFLNSRYDTYLAICILSGFIVACLFLTSE